MKLTLEQIYALHATGAKIVDAAHTDHFNSTTLLVPNVTDPLEFDLVQVVQTGERIEAFSLDEDRYIPSTRSKRLKVRDPDGLILFLAHRNSNPDFIL